MGYYYVPSQHPAPDAISRTPECECHFTVGRSGWATPPAISSFTSF